MLDVVIIGSGPAGLSAAIYAKRANLDAVVLEKEYLGTGQIAYSSRVDNYPGLPGKDGYSLGEAFLEHAEGLGVTIEEAEVTAITKKEQSFVISCEDGKNIEAKTVVYAAGCQNRRLGVPGEEKLLAKGVSFCAVCDGAFYKGKKAAVIGGGDTALDDALYLSDICEQVYLIHRRAEFRGAEKTKKKLEELSNVTILTNTRVQEITGEDKVNGIILDNGGTIAVDGVFEAVGMIPNTELLKNLDVLDEKGYVIAGEDCSSSLAGLFVAGDVRTKSLRQVVTAVADGAQIVLTSGYKGMKGAIEKAEELHKEIPGSIILGQFENPANPKAHEETTGPEIWEQTEGSVDIFVAGVGTGGTITGVGKYLKKQKKSVHIVAVEPATSPVLSQGKVGPHKIQGIGAGFIPDTLDTSVYDEIIPIKNDDAFEEGRAFARSEGILVGISAGAALKAAVELAKRKENKGKNIVVLLPDSGDRYLSTPLFAK